MVEHWEKKFRDQKKILGSKICYLLSLGSPRGNHLMDAWGLLHIGNDSKK